MTSDLRYAWRALWKSPTTTLGAILALALGIGATTTMFGLLNAVALRPLPHPESARIVELWGNVERQAVERRGTSIPDYIDWRDKSRSFDLMSAWSNANFIRYGGGAPEQVPGELVSGDYFAILGVEPLLGRVLTNNDDVAGATLAAVIGERLWNAVSAATPTPSAVRCSSTTRSSRSWASYPCASGAAPIRARSGSRCWAIRPTPNRTAAAADSRRWRGSRRARVFRPRRRM
jgi:hypothetical protein